MTSSEADGTADRGSFDVLPIASDQFEAIFQVLKEAPNLPDQVLRSLEEGAVHVASAVQAAREIVRSLESAVLVKIVIGHPESIVEMSESQFLSTISQTEVSGIVEALVNRGLVDSWRDLTAAVLASFSERELSLRTGYSGGELEQACRLLFD